MSADASELIKREVNKTFQSINELLTDNWGNLCYLFMHELYWYYNTAYLNRENQSAEILFGQRDGKSVQRSKKKKFFESTPVYKIRRNVSELIHRQSLAVEFTPISVNKAELYSCLSSKTYKLCEFNGVNSFSKKDFPEMEKQLALIKLMDDKICTKLNIAPCFPGLAGLLNQVLQQSADHKSPATVLVVGALGNFEHRARAFYYLQRGLRVVSVLHSEELGATKLESWEISDLSVATAIVGYGDCWQDLLQTNKYIKQPPVVYSGPSAVCAHHYKKHRNTSNRLVMYPATSKGLYLTKKLVRHSGVVDFHRAFNQNKYIEFLKSFSTRYPSVNIRLHPKSHIDISDDFQDLDTGTLDYDKYDFLVMDSIDTSAFAIAASTDKPICIIGPVNWSSLTEGAKKLVKKRCFIIESREFEVMSSRFFGQQNLELEISWEYTLRFSLSTGKLNREQLVAEAIYNANT